MFSEWSKHPVFKNKLFFLGYMNIKGTPFIILYLIVCQYPVSQVLRKFSVSLAGCDNFPVLLFNIFLDINTYCLMK